MQILNLIKARDDVLLSSRRLSEPQLYSMNRSNQTQDNSHDPFSDPFVRYTENRPHDPLSDAFVRCTEDGPQKPTFLL